MKDLRTHTSIQNKAIHEIGQLLKQVALSSPAILQLDPDIPKILFGYIKIFTHFGILRIDYIFLGYAVFT